MAEKKVNAALAQPPVDEADSVRQALIKDQIARRSGENTVPLPQGTRMHVGPAVELSYQGMNATMLLGAPEKILKNPKPGHKYVWKKRQDRQTSAWIRAGILRPVEADEVDTSNPMAEYVEDILPSGAKVVSWESLALFEMPPKWVRKIYEAPEEWAIARIAQNAEEFEGKVESTTGGAYRGSYKVTSK